MSKKMIMAAMAGATVAGYMYMKKNPTMMMAMKQKAKEVAKTAYDKLEDLD